MGYSEVHCRLCDVVFNISRLRKPDDPPSHAWMNTGDGNTRFVPAENRWDSSCTSEDGCYGVWRGKEPPDRRQGEGEWRAIAVDEDENDSNYVYESSDGEEEYEFESDDDLGDGEIEDLEGTEYDVEMTDADSEPEWARFLKSDSGLAYKPHNPHHHPDLMETEQPAGGKRIGDIIKIEKELADREVEGCEHIAGPTCTCDRGYNGHRITAEEMRGCTTFQCFVRKLERWSPDEHDQDFEATSTHFLSGLCDHMPSTDSGGDPEVIPARHGVEEVCASDTIWGLGHESMPFHTACLDIFLRMSKLEFGEFDVNGLCAWYYAEPEYHWSPKTERDKDIEACQNQWWIHADGTEYLAANPVFVPRLSQILRSAVSEDPNFDTQAGAFKGLGSPSAEGQDDRFTTLPLELRLEVLGYLDPKDIANLRLSSRTFYQLPIYLWRTFIQRDMPWLWETWSDQKPYLWSMVTVEALKMEKAEEKVFVEEFNLYRRVIREEMPELLDMWLGAERSIMDRRVDKLITQCESEALKELVWTVPPEKINWYQLYSDIARNWSSLKGLKNRSRIWQYERYIIDWIGKHREEKRLQNSKMFAS